MVKNVNNYSCCYVLLLCLGLFFRLEVVCRVLSRNVSVVLMLVSSAVLTPTAGPRLAWINLSTKGLAYVLTMGQSWYWYQRFQFHQ